MKKIHPAVITVGLLAVVLWTATLGTIFIAIWNGPWQMTVTAVVLSVLASVATAVAAIMQDAL